MSRQQEAVRRLIASEGMTTAEIALRVNLSQQRTAEILRELRAHVIGHKGIGKGRQARIFCMDAGAQRPQVDFSPLLKAWGYVAL